MSSSLFGVSLYVDMKFSKGPGWYNIPVKIRSILIEQMFDDINIEFKNNINVASKKTTKVLTENGKRGLYSSRKLNDQKKNS